MSPAKKNEEKSSAPDLDQLLKTFAEKKDRASFECCYDLIHELLQKDSIDKKSIYYKGLELCENAVAMSLQAGGILQKLNDATTALHKLLVKNPEWSEKEQERLQKCYSLLDMITKGKMKIFLPILEITVKAIFIQNNSQREKLKQKNERLLIKNPEGNATIWAELLGCYFFLNDHHNIIRCSEKFLQFTAFPKDRENALEFQYNAYDNLAETDKMIQCAKEMLQCHCNVPNFLRLIAAYLYNQDWNLALEQIKIMRGTFKFIWDGELEQYEKWAELGSTCRYLELATQIDKTLEEMQQKDAKNGKSLLGKMFLAGSLFTKALLFNYGKHYLQIRFRTQPQTFQSIVIVRNA